MPIEQSKGSALNRIDRVSTRSIRIQANKWLKKAVATTRKYKTEVLDEFGELFAERARYYLVNDGYNTQKYQRYIIYDKSKHRVVIKSPRSQEPDIMWYLEYGTGIMGVEDPHEEAFNIGWRYAINRFSGSAWKVVGGIEGWFFQKRSRFVYSAEGDFKARGHKNSYFTSGIQPIRYLYKAKQDKDKLLAKAKRIVRARYAGNG